MGFDISETILSKSDQLNADDLVGAPRRIKIIGTSKGNAESPVIVHYEGETGRPFKPCKTVRRILAAAWGVDSSAWEGQEAILYNDPSVVYAGKEVGGIRVQALSGITKKIVISLSKTRGKKIEHVIQIIHAKEPKTWPDDKLSDMTTQFKSAILSGERTPEQIINNLSAKGVLSDNQKQMIRDIGKGGADLVIDEDESGFFNDGVNE